MIIDRRHRVIKRITITGAIVNCLLAASQIVFGIVGHSQALLADGFHTLSDLLSDFIVLFAVKQSSAAADEDHPYGHGRIETLATVILGFLLVAAGLGIGYPGYRQHCLIAAKQPCINYPGFCRPGNSCQGISVPLYDEGSEADSFEPARIERLASSLRCIVVGRRAGWHIGPVTRGSLHGYTRGDRRGDYDHCHGD